MISTTGTQKCGEDDVQIESSFFSFFTILPFPIYPRVRTKVGVDTALYGVYLARVFSIDPLPVPGPDDPHKFRS